MGREGVALRGEAVLVQHPLTPCGHLFLISDIHNVTLIYTTSLNYVETELASAESI